MRDINRRILIVDDNPEIHRDIRGVFGDGPVDSSDVDAAERLLFGDSGGAPAQPSTEMELHSVYQGQEALEVVRAALALGRPYAMAFVDVRMPPGWDGIETIEQLWRVDPALQVVICTAYSDHSWGDIARRLGSPESLLILKKPFEGIEVLQLACALTEKWSVKRDEKELLELTLKGSIKALVGVLELTNPLIFGRAERVHRLVKRVLDRMPIQPRWPIEVAALVAQLGWVAIPAEIAERTFRGARLTPAEEEMVRRVPAVTQQLLQDIPRLEAVRAILPGPAAPRADATITMSRGVLDIATKLDILDGQLVPAAAALETLRRDLGNDRRLLEVFAAVLGVDAAASASESEVALHSLREGMVLAEDVRLQGGALLVARGYEVTAGLVARLGNLRPGMVKRTFRITTSSLTSGS